MNEGPGRSRTPTRLSAVLFFTAVCSIGTGVVWNGLPFIAEHDYGFTQLANLWLSFFLGAVYIGGAFGAARVMRILERRFPPRTLLATIVLTQAVVCLGPGLFDAVWMIWVVTGVTAALSAILWPLIESYLSSGRHGRAMRHAIGWWNVTWTISVGIALLLMAPLMGEDSRHARYAIVALGALNGIAAIILLRFTARPAEHDEVTWQASVGPEYPMLLRSARVLLPTSYVLLALISPLMPYRLDDLDLSSEWKTPLTATWMFARCAVVAMMWRVQFWHGRWGTLLLAASALILGFATIVLAPTIPVMLAGLALFGIGQGMTYFAAIYYALSVGRARVDASGIHEGLIGVGYAGGPLVGIIGVTLAANTGDYLTESTALVVVAMLVVVAILPFSARPYFRARARRKTPLAV